MCGLWCLGKCFLTNFRTIFPILVFALLLNSGPNHIILRCLFLLFIFSLVSYFVSTNARQHIFLGDLFKMVICKTLSTCQLWYKLNLHQQILQLIYTNKYQEILTSMNWRDNSLVYFLIISLKLLICAFAHWPQDFDWNDRLNEANISSMGLFHYVSWNGYHSQRNLFWLDSRQSVNSIEWVFSRHLLSSWDYSVCF